MPPPRRRRDNAAVTFEATRRARRSTVHGMAALPAGRFWEQLRSVVRRGVLPAGTLLVEGELLTRFGASRASVRTGLRLLAEEGLVKREVRTGTPVVTGVAEVNVLAVVPGRRSPGPGRLRVVTLVGEVLDPLPPALADVLELPAGGAALRLEQVAELDGRAIYLRSALLPLHGVPDLHARVLRLDEAPRSLTDSFTTLFDAVPGAMEAALTASPAGGSVARHLRIERGSPVLVREMLMRDDTGRVRDLSTTYYRGDAVSLTSAGTSTGSPAPSPGHAP